MNFLELFYLPIYNIEKKRNANARNIELILEIYLHIGHNIEGESSRVVVCQYGCALLWKYNISGALFTPNLKPKTFLHYNMITGLHYCIGTKRIQELFFREIKTKVQFLTMLSRIPAGSSTRNQQTPAL